MAQESNARARAAAPVSLEGQIQWVALQLFAERGFDQVTMVEIAEHAGITLPDLERHFPRKHQLFKFRPSSAYRVVNCLVRRPDGEDAKTAIGRAFLDSNRRFHHDEAVEVWRRGLATAPEIARHSVLVDPLAREAVVKELERRLGVSRAVDLRPEVLMETGFAAVRVGYERWLGGDQRSIHELTRDCLEAAGFDVSPY